MILTAEALAEIIDTDFYKENHYYWSQTEPITFAAEVALQFARLQVQEALKAATEKASLIKDENQDFRFQSCNCVDYILDKESILNAYPLENIK